MIQRHKFAVTGGAGFIGSNIVKRLVEDNNDITVIDNLLTGRIENLEDFKNEIQFINGDIQDLNFLKKEFKDIDYVLHQAALPSVQRSVEDPILTNRNNVDGTLNVLVAARDAGVKRVVFAASSSVYGDTPTLPKHEAMPTNPLSPYAISKLIGEQYCRVFFELYGLETVSLRYFNVFGPKQDPNSHYSAVIPKFIKAMLENKRPVIFGDGEQSRDFTYVENNVDANLLACSAADAPGKVFNIAIGERITLNQLVEMINRILDKEIKPIYEKDKPGDIKHSHADISCAKKILGYEPEYGFEDGLQKTVEWFQAH
jgi:nucleoside-diphosphate-sugar epimerase